MIDVMYCLELIDWVEECKEKIVDNFLEISFGFSLDKTFHILFEKSVMKKFYLFSKEISFTAFELLPLALP